MSNKTPAVYTVERLRVLYRVFLDKYDYLKLSPLAFFNWLDARGSKIEDYPLDESIQP